MQNKMTNAEKWERPLDHMKDKMEKANDKYVPWMEGGTKKSETIEGIFAVLFIIVWAAMPIWWPWLDAVIEKILK